jgi:arylsulfatase
LIKRVRWESPQALSPGKHTIVFDFKYNGLGAATLAYNNLSGVGRGGTGTLSVDGTVVATQSMDRTIPLVMPLDQTFGFGGSSSTPVDDHDYQVPFEFTGKINKLTIALDRPKLTSEDVKKLEAAYRAAQDAN